MPIIVCLIGPSGCGKTTIAKLLMEEKIATNFIKSSTTRPKNSKEDNFEYYFVDDFKEEDMVEFTVYDGNKYGISNKEATKALEHNVSVVAVDIKGFMALSNFYKKIDEDIAVLGVGIDASDANIKKRLFARGRGRVKERMARLEQDRNSFGYCDIVFINDEERHAYYIVDNIVSLMGITNVTDIAKGGNDGDNESDPTE